MNCFIDYNGYTGCNKDLFIEYLKENTNSVEDSFCISGNYVSQLISNDAKITYAKDDEFDINYSGLIHKVQIVDFAGEEYDMTIIGSNVMESENGVFDFEKGMQNKSSKLGAYMFHARGVEPDIPDREKYLNFRRIDTISIQRKNKPQIVPGIMIRVKLFGYFYEQNTWTEYKEKVVEIYLHQNNSQRLNLYGAVDSLDIYSQSNSGTVELYLDGFLHSTTEITDFPFQRIKFRDPEQKYCTKSSTVLTDTINTNTLNFDRIEHTYFVFKNCVINRIVANRYQTYKHPHRTILGSLDNYD
jgi:hypothetical protein